MLTLIITIIFGALFGLFAAQNNQTVTLYFGNYVLPDVPIYLLVLFSIGVSLSVAFVIHIMKDLSRSMTLKDLQTEISKLKKQTAELTKEVHQLELENTKLKAALDEDFDENAM